MAAEAEKINGVRKAAIVLVALGEECASKVLSHLRPREVQEVGFEMTRLKDINREQVTQVLTVFAETADHTTNLTFGTDEYVRKVMERALGEEKARNLMERILQDNKSHGLETFKWMDARSIAEVIRAEHPQIIAIVLSHLEHDHAANVMGYFPEHLRADVLLRIASIDSIQPEALQELNNIMEKQFAGNTHIKTSMVGGVKSAAQILNNMDAMLESEILDNIREMDPQIGQSIQDVMFVFDNMADLADRDIQTILREISSDSLLLAMKNAGDKVKQKIYKNMSKRAAQMLREDLDAKGPVKVSDVDSAQKEILSTVRRLADAGDISLRAKGVDEYI